MKWALLLSLIPLSALADGLSEVPPYTNPCEEVFPTREDYISRVHDMDPEIAYQLAVGLRDALCDDVALPIDSIFLNGMTEDEVLRSVFNGHQVPTAPIPLSGSLWFLSMSLGFLYWIRRI